MSSSMIWIGTTQSPPTQVSVGELFIQERKTGGGGDPFSGKGSGGPRSNDSTETVVLYIIYYTPLAPWWSRETGELLILYSVMKTGAAKLRWARRRGAQRPALQVSDAKRRVREAHGRARASIQIATRNTY